MEAQRSRSGKLVIIFSSAAPTELVVRDPAQMVNSSSQNDIPGCSRHSEQFPDDLDTARVTSGSETLIIEMARPLTGLYTLELHPSVRTGVSLEVTGYQGEGVCSDDMGTPDTLLAGTTVRRFLYEVMSAGSCEIRNLEGK